MQSLQKMGAKNRSGKNLNRLNLGLSNRLTIGLVIGVTFKLFFPHDAEAGGRPMVVRPSARQNAFRKPAIAIRGARKPIPRFSAVGAQGVQISDSARLATQPAASHSLSAQAPSTATPTAKSSFATRVGLKPGAPSESAKPFSAPAAPPKGPVSETPATAQAAGKPGAGGWLSRLFGRGGSSAAATGVSPAAIPGQTLNPVAQGSKPALPERPWGPGKSTQTAAEHDAHKATSAATAQATNQAGAPATPPALPERPWGPGKATKTALEYNAHKATSAATVQAANHAGTPATPPASPGKSASTQDSSHATMPTAQAASQNPSGKDPLKLAPVQEASTEADPNLAEFRATPPATRTQRAELFRTTRDGYGKVEPSTGQTSTATQTVDEHKASAGTAHQSAATAQSTAQASSPATPPALPEKPWGPGKSAKTAEEYFANKASAAATARSGARPQGKQDAHSSTEAQSVDSAEHEDSSHSSGNAASGGSKLSKAQQTEPSDHPELQKPGMNPARTAMLGVAAGLATGVAIGILSTPAGQQTLSQDASLIGNNVSSAVGDLGKAGSALTAGAPTKPNPQSPLSGTSPVAPTTIQAAPQN